MRVRQAIVLALSAAACAVVAATASGANTKPVDQYYVMTMHDLGNSHWELGVFNTNPNAKFIGTFWWIPPVGMTIQSLQHVVGGTCSIGGNALTCKGNVAPPNCFTCIGASMKMDFTATGDEPTFVKTSYGGYWIHYGVLGILNVTSLNSFGDLPACAKGQKSTKAKPCSSGT
jgi:hypothetical protein